MCVFQRRFTITKTLNLDFQVKKTQTKLITNPLFGVFRAHRFSYFASVSKNFSTCFLWEFQWNSTGDIILQYGLHSFVRFCYFSPGESEPFSFEKPFIMTSKDLIILAPCIMLVPALYNRSLLETIVYIMPIGRIIIFFNPLTTI